MNKYLLGLIAILALVIAPSFASAISGDVDPQGDSSCVSIVNNLRYKMNDAKTDGEVSVLQDFLQAGGYLNSNPVGYFGLMTTAAVKKFQSANGISATGYVGPITREKIRVQSCAGQTNVGSLSTTTPTVIGRPTVVSGPNVGPTSPTVSSGDATNISRTLDIGSTGADVTALQLFLVTRGWLSMTSGTVYGVFDQNTKNAVSGYQQSKGIGNATGVVGPGTRASLNAEMSNISSLVSSVTTNPVGSSFDFSAKVNGHYFTYELVTYTVRYDNNKVDPSSIGIKLSCPAGVTASLDAVTDGINRCDVVVPLFDPLNVSQHNGIVTHEVSVRFINSTSLYQVINSNLVLNGKVNLDYHNSVIIPKSETSVTAGPNTGPTKGQEIVGFSTVNIPTITSISPLSGPAGTIINVTGTNLNTTNTTPFGNAVSIDGRHFSITVPVGTTAGVYGIGVIIDHQLNFSNVVNFTVTSPTNPSVPPTTVTPPTTPTVNTTCPQSLIINGTTYTISPCSINVTMTDGQGDKNFSTTINAVGPSPSFGYSTRGYGVGFPDYGISGGGSGGANGNGATTLNLQFNDSVLSADGKSPKTYSGYLPIHIFQGSETGFDNNFLNLNVSVTVNPAN